MLYSRPFGGQEEAQSAMQEHAKALHASHLGTSFLIVLGGALYLGYRVDLSLGTTPLFMLLGVGGGFAAGFYYLYYEVFVRPKVQRELSESTTAPDEADAPQDPGRAGSGTRKEPEE